MCLFTWYLILNYNFFFDDILLLHMSILDIKESLLHALWNCTWMKCSWILHKNIDRKRENNAEGIKRAGITFQSLSFLFYLYLLMYWGKCICIWLGQMNENSEGFAGFCALNSWWQEEVLPSQAHPQSHLEIPGPGHAEPHWPYLHQQEVQVIMEGCMDDVMCWHIFRLPSTDNTSQVLAQDIFLHMPWIRTPDLPARNPRH